MDIIIQAILIAAAFIIVLSFFNIKLAVALYVAFLILVPFLDFKVAPGLTLSYNLLNAALLLGFVYKYRIRAKMSLNFDIIKPFFFLYGTLFILTFVQLDVSWSYQFESLSTSFMRTSVLGFIIWNIGLNDVVMVTYIKRAILISFTVAACYGGYLTKLQGDNPYNSSVAVAMNVKQDFAASFASEKGVRESRVSFSNAGKIQATMNHPMTWCLNICFVFFILLCFAYKKMEWWLFPLFALLVFCLLTAGVRTGIASLMMGTVYFVVRARNLKIIILAAIIAVVVGVSLSTDAKFRDMLASFTDISGTKSNTKGSSITMRLDQMRGAINEIKDNPWVGHGYGWTKYYSATKGQHPVLLFFESLIFVVLCEGGIVGTVIWIVFFLLLLRMNRKLLSDNTDIIMMDTIIIIFLSYTVGTGEYGYMHFFLLYYTFLTLFLKNSTHKFIKFRISHPEPGG